MRSFLADRLARFLPSHSESRRAGDAETYWSPTNASERLRAEAHWAGFGPWEEREAWSALGERHFRFFEDLCRAAGVPRPIRAMVDWGCGGGANAVRFACEVERIYGVEVGASTLDECARQMRETGHPGFRPVRIPLQDPEECLAQILEPCELFLSTGVYQCFPSKEYGARVTRLAHRLVAPGGIALIQTTYDQRGERYPSRRRAYSRYAAHFTTYRIEEFWTIAEASGFQPMSVTLCPSANRAYYFLRRPP